MEAHAPTSIAAEAVAEVDLRIAHKSDGPRMERKVKVAASGQSRIASCISKAALTGLRWSAPSRWQRCSRRPRKLAASLGLSLNEIAVGGGSDGNFTAGIGVPTLDGLGAVGDGAHASHEYVVAAELPRRAALLAGLIAAV